MQPLTFCLAPKHALGDAKHLLFVIVITGHPRRSCAEAHPYLHMAWQYQGALRVLGDYGSIVLLNFLPYYTGPL